MNKYIVRTSLVWMGVIAAVIAVWRVQRMHHAADWLVPSASSSAAMQPVAQGPAPSAAPTAISAMTGGQPAQTSSETAIQPLQISPERMQSIGVQIGTAEYKLLDNDVRATGNVDIDQRLLAYVQVRFSGYIQKVFANAVYQYVTKGEPLFTIYSPDLVATEQEYLLARQNQTALGTSTVDGVSAGAATLEQAAEQRLQQWEIPSNEMESLQKTGKVIQNLTINSPVSGYITEYNALPNLYVEPSTRLYTVADLSQVWVYAQVFQDDIGRLQPGDAASITVDSYPGQSFHGRIDEILPQVDLTTRTVRVRLVIANRGFKLKPGMFVNVDLKSGMGRQLVIPASAVLQTGTRQVVFIDQGNGTLNPRNVVLGPRAGDQYVVLKGLKAHERIVTSANFLIDSESQLQAAAGSFAPPQPGAGSHASTPNTQAKMEFTTDPSPPHAGSNVLRVRLTNAAGAPIHGAQVTATFYMPAMLEMGMSAMKTVVPLSDKGDGLYVGQGNLGSGGDWQVTITAQQNGSLLASKLLHVNAEGGM